MSGKHRAIQETNKARIGVAGALMHTGNAMVANGVAGTEEA